MLVDSSMVHVLMHGYESAGTLLLFYSAPWGAEGVAVGGRAVVPFDFRLVHAFV